MSLVVVVYLAVMGYFPQRAWAASELRASARETIIVSLGDFDSELNVGFGDRQRGALHATCVGDGLLF